MLRGHITVVFILIFNFLFIQYTKVNNCIQINNYFWNYTDKWNGKVREPQNWATLLTLKCLTNVTPVLAYLTHLFEIGRLKCELFCNCIYNTKHERLNTSTLRNSRRVKEMHLSVLLPQPGKLLYKFSNFEGPFHLMFGFFVKSSELSPFRVRSTPLIPPEYFHREFKLFKNSLAQNGHLSTQVLAGLDWVYLTHSA